MLHTYPSLFQHKIDELCADEPDWIPVEFSLVFALHDADEHFVQVVKVDAVPHVLVFVGNLQRGAKPFFHAN